MYGGGTIVPLRGAVKSPCRCAPRGEGGRQYINQKPPGRESARAIDVFCAGVLGSGRLVYQFNHYFSTTLGLVGTALHASCVAGNSGTALRALAELRGLPSLSGQAGALLHLGRSAFRSCHSSISCLRFSRCDTLSRATALIVWETNRVHPRRFHYSGQQSLHPIGGLCPV